MNTNNTYRVVSVSTEDRKIIALGRPMDELYARALHKMLEDDSNGEWEYRIERIRQ